MKTEEELKKCKSLAEANLDLGRKQFNLAKEYDKALRSHMIKTEEQDERIATALEGILNYLNKKQ